jgi:NhaP-type Na+/H+ or K+/H+ antiporter
MTAVAVVAGMLLLIGFVCGYGVRALTSRLQRAKARRRHFERLAKEGRRGGS